MKKYAVCVTVTVFLVLGAMLGFVSCTEEKVNVEELLSYQSQSSHSGVIFCIGESEYETDISLGSLTGEYFVRDAQVIINKGTLEGMAFSMQDGMLKLKASDFEIELTEKDSPAIYALISAFSIEPSEFIGITQSSDYDGKLSARFGGKYEYELTLEKSGDMPDIIKVKTDKDTYTIKLKELQENGEGASP